jgi:hypothetical protein
MILPQDAASMKKQPTYGPANPLQTGLFGIKG